VSPLGLCRKDIFRTGGKDKCVRGFLYPFEGPAPRKA
jgi:hypothetical protein